MFDSIAFLKTTTSRPGVYCMKDSLGKVLYVGKAKNLKARLASYFRISDDLKTIQLVKKIAHIDVTVTSSEKEALLLENSMIKSLNPRFNVIFKDDKSYPYLFISKHEYPRLVYFRGKQKLPGKYFGPYPSGMAVRETLSLLQKLFQVRQCDDHFFKNRSRPCIQYQIERCTAPCVGYIEQESYAKDVQSVVLFLEGKENAIVDNLIKRMEVMAHAQDFESAAKIRDQITQLRAVQENQRVYRDKGNIDVLAAQQSKGHFCVHLLYVRHGQVLDSQTFFPKQVGEGKTSELLRGFLTQFYLGKEHKIDYPQEILLNENIEDQNLIAQALSQIAQRKVSISQPSRGDRAKWMELANENAIQALDRKASQGSLILQRVIELKKVLGISHQINRIECFDVSHLHSEATMASCVVFDQNGPLKSEYRRYHLDVNAHDDYAAMEKVLSTRFMKRKAQESVMPEIIIVDGGKGQLHKAQKVMLECQILDVWLIGIAKGLGRKPGLETLYVARPQSEEEGMIKLPPTSGALHLLQHIRDEAHRFAIAGQRQKTRKTRKQSPLEAIPGVGVKRRQQLLNHFGGLQALLVASSDAISKVPGISSALANSIYQALHGD